MQQSHFVYPVGKSIKPHLRRYQGFAVAHHSVTLDALYLGHPRLSLNWGVIFVLLLFLMSACAHYPVNTKLESLDTALEEKGAELAEVPDHYRQVEPATG